MRYLLIHNRYYHESGPETYLLNLKRVLENQGHIIDVFALDYKKNIKCDISKYHPKPIGERDKYSYKDQKLSLFQKFKLLASLFYRHHVYRKLDAVLKKNNYDGAIVLQFWGKLSPSIFRALELNNVPTAVRISDFGLICGTNTLLKNNQHSDECIKSTYSCIKHKCVDNSYIKSTINSIAQLYFFKKYSKKLKYIYTCKNTQSIFKQAGYSVNSHHIPTFYPTSFIEKESFNHKKIIYLGRIAEDKGIHNIIQLIPDESNIAFEIWGSGSEDYISNLKYLASNRKSKNIHIKGHINHLKVPLIFEDALCSIIPSQWHDNLPNSLIESLSNGVPVIAPNHGCFPEFIKEDINGFLYDETQDLKDIFVKISDLNLDQKKKLSLNSTTFAKETFNSKIHINKLLNVFEKK